MRRTSCKVFGVLATLLGLAACSGGSSPHSTSSTPAGHAASSTSTPRAAGYTGPLPPLPEVRYAAARPAPILRAAYEFAGRHPEVLRSMPCFCGCERNGHGHNEDCFVAKREADGRPEWNPHGVGCGICIDVAHQAMQMYNAGAALGDIRKAIDAKYRSEYPTSTPTPHPH